MIRTKGMTANGVKELIIVYGALFAFVLVIGKLVERRSSIQRNLIVLLMLSIGFYQLTSYYLYCLPPDRILPFPDAGYLLEAFGFMLFLFCGPLNYGYCRSVITPRSPLPRHYWVHFLPGVIYLAAYIPFGYFQVHAGKGVLNDGLFYPGHDRGYLFSIILSVISFNSYMLVCLKKVIPVLIKYRGKYVIFLAMGGTYLFSFSAVSFWPFDILFHVDFTDDVRVLTTGYLITMYLISRRQPEQVLLADSADDHGRYMKSQLNGMDVSSVISRLESLMRNEKIFKTDISLGDLAERLNVRKHQLSEILNASMNTTFSRYVNDRRVDESGYLLRNCPEMSIVEISLEVGFNSLSVYYREFKKREGISPLEYRKKNAPAFDDCSNPPRENRNLTGS